MNGTLLSWALALAVIWPNSANAETPTNDTVLSTTLSVKSIAAQMIQDSCLNREMLLHKLQCDLPADQRTIIIEEWVKALFIETLDKYNIPTTKKIEWKVKFESFYASIPSWITLTTYRAAEAKLIEEMMIDIERAEQYAENNKD